MKISSPAFGNGDPIPRRHTCEGEDVPPMLVWEEVPPGVRSFALIAEDPDAPSGNFVHWVVYDLPPDTTQLPESAALPDGAQLGKNHYGTESYRGPCPPPGKPHRYYFRLYALDSTLGLAGGATADEVRNAMRDHVLAEAETMGTWQR